MNNRLPSYIKDMVKLRDNVKDLRGTNKLVLPRANTSPYGLKSTVYTATKQWNALPDNIRVITSEKEFKISLMSIFKILGVSLYVCIYTMVDNIFILFFVCNSNFLGTLAYSFGRDLISLINPR